MARSKHEAAKFIVARFADEGDAQSQPRRAAGEDRRRAANGQHGIVDDLLHLPEGRHDVAAQNQIGVQFADDEHIKISIGHGSSWQTGRPGNKESWSTCPLVSSC
jgi:hypothetical protein